MTSDALTAEIKRLAAALGFARVGVTAAVAPVEIRARLEQWLAAGYAGEMHYLGDRSAAYADPSAVLDGARSIVMLAMNYRTQEPAALAGGFGRVSRYAWGSDYHQLIRRRLNTLGDQIRQLAPQAAVRGVVDTAPLMERELAQLAGLGWIGKNTLLLDKSLGSWFFLAALLTDLDLACDQPSATDHCGTCRACLDACPTGAFVDAYVLDARRCISYLTIEHRSTVAHELRPGLGDWVFGCDICQDVCPWNRRAPESPEPGFAPAEHMNPLDLAGLFWLDDEAFRQRFRHSPLWRPKRRGLLRNAALVLGNQRHQDSLPALARGLDDFEPLIRGACAWALGRLDVPPAAAALARRLATETDPEVRDEICGALDASD